MSPRQHRQRRLKQPNKPTVKVAKRSGAREETAPTAAQIRAELDEKQRLLGENADQMHNCEVKINECREQLDYGRDRGHFKWMAAAAIFTLGGVCLMASALLIPACICFGVGVILTIRWLADLSHSLKQYSREAKRLQFYSAERDRLTGECSRLRLETTELRRKLDASGNDQ